MYVADACQTTGLTVPVGHKRTRVALQIAVGTYWQLNIPSLSARREKRSVHAHHTGGALGAS
jgi:hypothetical protein